MFSKRIDRKNFERLINKGCEITNSAERCKYTAEENTDLDCLNKEKTREAFFKKHRHIGCLKTASRAKIQLDKCFDDYENEIMQHNDTSSALTECYLDQQEIIKKCIDAYAIDEENNDLNKSKKFRL